MCFDCMKEHEVQVVEVEEKNIFKNEEVIYQAEYDYCENTDDFLKVKSKSRKMT